MMKGKILILSGPSGAGKTTLYKKLLASRQFKGRLVKTVSVTTRARRVGERHGRDYFFVSPAMFAHKKRAGHFLESMKVFDNFYGTPWKQVKDWLKKGQNVLLCIDVQGARVVARKFPESVRIFVKTSSISALKKRLVKRGSEKGGSLSLRLKTAVRELREAKDYDYVVVNDHLPSAVRELEKIVEKEICAQS